MRSCRLYWGAGESAPRTEFVRTTRAPSEACQARTSHPQGEPGMKKKKKLSRKPPAEEEALDEIEALRAIYGDDAFQLAADGSSFSVLVKALEGSGDAPVVSAPAVRVVRLAVARCPPRGCAAASRA